MDDQSKEHVVRPDTGALYEHDKEWKEAKAEFQLKWEADYRKITLITIHK